MASLLSIVAVGFFLCAVARSDRNAYRFGGITLAIVLLVPRTGPASQIAFQSVLRSVHRNWGGADVGGGAAVVTNCAGSVWGAKGVTSARSLPARRSARKNYDLGYFDLETRVLEPIDNPFGPRLLPM
jgi:hypothetical protein